MARIVWTRQAREDLERLIEYIGTDSRTLARRFARRIVDRVETLRDTPLLGSFIAEDERQIYREVLHGTYRIIYRAENDRVFIVSIYHGARLLQPGDLK